MPNPLSPRVLHIHHTQLIPVRPFWPAYGLAFDHSATQQISASKTFQISLICDS